MEESYRNRKAGSLGVRSPLLFITESDRYRRHLPCDGRATLCNTLMATLYKWQNTTVLPSIAEWREQVNIGGNGSWGEDWELWGRVREPGSSISFGENLGRQIKTPENTFLMSRNNFRFFVFLDLKLLFPTMWMAAGGWELWERARERRVRKTLLVVGFRR